MFIQKACGGGEIDITLLYTMKSPLDWSPSTYGYFLATTYACVGLTTLALLPFLIRFFHLTDLTLVAIGYVFKAASLAMIAYGQHTWLVFLSAVVGSPGVLIMTSAKSIISKLVVWRKRRESYRKYAVRACLRRHRQFHAEPGVCTRLLVAVRSSGGRVSRDQVIVAASSQVNRDTIR